MHLWTKVTLAALTLLLAGCVSLPEPAPVVAPETPRADSAPASLTDAERHRKYDELRTEAAAIPHVLMVDFDERLDKLVIDADTLEAMQGVRQAMTRLGLPTDSVVINPPRLLLSEAAPFEGCQVGKVARDDDGGGGGLVIPAVMDPGQEFDLAVALHVPEDKIMRGVDSYLDCWDGTAWSTRFMLQVGWGSPKAKPTARVGAGGVVVSLGLPGPGPERLVLPANIPPGWYRIRKQVHADGGPHTLTALFEVRPKP